MGYNNGNDRNYRPRSAYGAPCTPRKPRSMAARFGGECKGCGDRFPAGARITWSKADGARLVGCPGCNGTRPAPTATKVAVVGEVAGILALFDRAREHLKFPKVRLQLIDGTPVVLSVAGKRARFPGSLNVTDGGGYGEGRWFGRIHEDGHFQAGRDARGAGSELVQLLGDLAANPAGVAAEYGRLLGACCFCGLKLTDERSTAMGYGKTCAGHWGVPWGSKVAVADGTVEDRPRGWRPGARDGSVPRSDGKDTAEALVDGDLF